MGFFTKSTAASQGFVSVTLATCLTCFQAANNTNDTVRLAAGITAYASTTYREYGVPDWAMKRLVEYCWAGIVLEHQDLTDKFIMFAAHYALAVKAYETSGRIAASQRYVEAVQMQSKPDFRWAGSPEDVLELLVNLLTAGESMALEKKKKWRPGQ